MHHTTVVGYAPRIGLHMAETAAHLADHVLPPVGRCASGFCRCPSAFAGACITNRARSTRPCGFCSRRLIAVCAHTVMPPAQTPRGTSQRDAYVQIMAHHRIVVETAIELQQRGVLQREHRQCRAQRIAARGVHCFDAGADPRAWRSTCARSPRAPVWRGLGAVSVKGRPCAALH